MTRTLTLTEAQAQLADVIRTLNPDDEVEIIDNGRVVAKLTVPPPAERPQPVLGRGVGAITIVRDDDSHLEDFAEYVS